MSLITGARLGPYEITGTLGAGGMGEVYRARDRKLNRDVALKILPDAFAADAERLARFQREAQVLASLNHPHIGAIYGFEDSGETHALVLELVEGHTLADRIARGPLPFDEAVPIARQIADALQAAHEQGIIHRDLKPANIKITPDGVVKVLDFGLAKLTTPNGPSDPNAANGRSLSPTITSPAMMTGVGMLLGTAAYMSPEQAKGREADKRSDIWAFACVVYEMLTGRRAFDGDDMTEVLGAVVRLEPNWEALPSDVPRPVRTLLQRCLVKDRRARIADVSAVLFILDHHAGLTVADAGSGGPMSQGPRWHRLAWMAAAGGLIALLAGAGVWLQMRPAPPSVIRTTITTSGSAALSLSGNDRDLVITPDGSRVVYRGNNQLLMRALNQVEPTVLTSSGAPRGVFVSPDGLSIGFFDGATIKTVPSTGGPAMTVCVVQGTPRGATWGADGTIVYATNVLTGLQRVPAGGGEPTALTTPDRERGEDHWWPEFLPGGKAVLFTIVSAAAGIDNAQIAVLDLKTGTSKVLIRGGSHAHYSPTAHLVYGVGGTLRAVAFDLERLEVVGTTTQVLSGVMTTQFGAADVALAANGSLVYVPGVAGGSVHTVALVDRQGHSSPLPGLPPDSYGDVRVSPDGTRVALATRTDVLTYDVVRAVPSRLTTDPARDRSPLWTPDGQRLIFTSNRSGYAELFWRQADGTGSDEPLLTRANDLLDLRANSWSKDGKHLLFSEVSPSRSANQCTIGQLDIERPSEAHVLVKSDACNDWPAVSPGGNWMAYGSNSSGRYEIYIERYPPELGKRITISTGGGRHPIWSRDGRELFFVGEDGRQIYALAVQAGESVVAGRPAMLFEFAMPTAGAGARPYDVAPDGRFVMIRSGETDAGGAAASTLILIQNWFEELKRLVPTN